MAYHGQMWLTIWGASTMSAATLIRPWGGNRLQVFKSDIPWCGSAICLIGADMLVAAGSQSSPVHVGISSVACWLVWLVCVNLSTKGSMLISLLRLWTHNRPFFDFPRDLSMTLCNLTMTLRDMIQTFGTACTLFWHPEELRLAAMSCIAIYSVEWFNFRVASPWCMLLSKILCKLQTFPFT